MYSDVFGLFWKMGKFVLVGLSFLHRSVCLSISSSIPIDSPSWYLLFIRHTTCSMGSFINYVDRILPFFAPPPCVDSFNTLSVDKNRHFLTPSPPPPHLVHVVIECPLLKNLFLMWTSKVMMSRGSLF